MHNASSWADVPTPQTESEDGGGGGHSLKARLLQIFQNLLDHPTHLVASNQVEFIGIEFESESSLATVQIIFWGELHIYT